MASIPAKMEIEIKPTMKGKKLPLIQRVSPDELNRFMKRNDIVRGEIFIEESTGDVYVVEKGDLDLYWLRMGKIESEKEKLELETEKLELNENPFLN